MPERLRKIAKNPKGGEMWNPSQTNSVPPCASKNSI